MRTIAGVLPVRRGALVDAGRSIEKLGAADRVAAGIALVPEGRLVFPGLSPSPTIFVLAPTRTAPGKIAWRGPRRCMKCFRACASAVGKWLAHYRAVEQQMLALARGLMSEPTLLLLDEPSIGLCAADRGTNVPDHRKNPRWRTSILIVEQDIAGTLEIADYGYVMENERITIEGEPALCGTICRCLATI